MKVAALLSGGKDSVYAIHYANQQGYEVCCLLSAVSRNPESYMYHTLKIDRVGDIARALGIKLYQFETAGIKEEELKDLKKALNELKEKEGIMGVVSGALASDYQKTRIERICYELDLAPISPLWHVDPKTYMDFVLEAGFDVRIVGCFADGLDDSWVGKRIDKVTLQKLENLDIHTAGEGGEYETLVIDGPEFKEKISW